MGIETVNGAKFISRNDMILQWRKNNAAEFEPETFAWLMSKMGEPRGHYVDVGVSTGFFAIPMLLRGHRVTAVEPNKRVVARLNENLALNDLTGQIELIEAAASAKQGRATFYHNPRVPLTSGGSINAPTCAGPNREEVETIALDDVIFSPVRVLKIDVENHELAVLTGAKELIEKNRPFLMLEANTDKLRAGLANWLEGAGYKWQQADDRNMLCEPA